MLGVASRLVVILEQCVYVSYRSVLNCKRFTYGLPLCFTASWSERLCLRHGQSSAQRIANRIAIDRIKFHKSNHMSIGCATHTILNYFVFVRCRSLPIHTATFEFFYKEKDSVYVVWNTRWISQSKHHYSWSFKKCDSFRFDFSISIEISEQCDYFVVWIAHFHVDFKLIYGKCAFQYGWPMWRMHTMLKCDWMA